MLWFVRGSVFVGLGKVGSLTSGATGMERPFPNGMWCVASARVPAQKPVGLEMARDISYYAVSVDSAQDKVYGMCECVRYGMVRYGYKYLVLL